MLGKMRGSLHTSGLRRASMRWIENSSSFRSQRSTLSTEGKNKFVKSRNRSSFNDIAVQLENERSVNRSRMSTCVSKARRLIAKAMTLQQVDIFLGIVILFDFYAGIKGVDMRASDEAEPLWLSISSNVCFAVYAVELTCALFVKGIRALTKFWTAFDAIIVLAGITEMIVAICVADPDGALIIIRFLRVFRIVRLMKLFHRFRFLSELQRLVRMFMACMKTLFWSFLFCFVVMTCWSMAAVDLLQEYLAEATEAGKLDTCPQCQTALHSVYHANIMFFKTAVAGDGWGSIAVPIMETHPWSSIIFVGAHATIVFGVLNLIVAVIVDEFAESRVRDVTAIAIEMDAKADQDRSSLVKMFKEIDVDSSGEVELEELLESVARVPEFSARLRVMDVDERDLRQLFEMLDEDKSGSVSSDEFITALNRWMNDSKTAARFVKHNTEQSIVIQQRMHEDLVKRMSVIEQRLTQVVRAQVEADEKSTGRDEDKSDLEDEQEVEGSFSAADCCAEAADQLSTLELVSGAHPRVKIVKMHEETVKVDALCRQIAHEAFQNLEDALRTSIGNALSMRNEAIGADLREDSEPVVQAGGYCPRDRIVRAQCQDKDPDKLFSV